MKINFYGNRLSPPTTTTAKAFGVSAEPIRLPGGQGTTFKAGSIVLKPAENNEMAVWTAELFASLPDSVAVRLARPIKSSGNSWLCDGYVAWSLLNGDHAAGQYDRKLEASIAFHELLQPIAKPDFVGLASSSWASADLVAWGKRDADYEPEFNDLINQITPHLHAYDAPFQLIHGDLSGNFLLASNMPAAVIDFSPAWAPAGFAEGIMLADAVAWEGASDSELKAFKQVPDIEQLAWRGVLRRIAEQAEHMAWFNKDKDQALQEARIFLKAIDYLEKL